MNNGFIVSVPKDLSLIKSKLMFGLTKRQMIGFGIGLALGIPFFVSMYRINTDLAMFGSVGIMTPFFVGALYQKDRLPAEVWIKLWIEDRFVFQNKRTYELNNKSRIVAKERGVLRVRKKKPATNEQTTLSKQKK